MGYLVINKMSHCFFGSLCLTGDQCSQFVFLLIFLGGYVSIVAMSLYI